MNEKCKYCNYVSKCSQYCEYNSVICKLHRSFSKVVDRSYEELIKENQELNKKIDILIDNVAEYENECNKCKEIIDKAIYFVEDYIFQVDGDEDFEFLLKILRGNK